MAEYFAGGHLRFVNGEWRDDSGNAIEISHVRHGRWVCGDYYDVGDVCSECDWDSLISPCDYRYCPNCGAKIDGGADDVSD